MKLAVLGSSGRMGREVTAVAKEFGLTPVGGWGRSVHDLETWMKTNGKVDVVIDFSLPAATSEIAKLCAAQKIPLVSGVTGLGEEPMAALKEAAKKTAVLWSANMSVGIQILIKALEALKGAEGYEIAMEETHHIHKKDHPSGTALMLEREIDARTGRKVARIESIREGEVIGDHKVTVSSPAEVLTFGHSAKDRSVFARGACRAARWVCGKPAGFYRLQDIL